MTGPPIWGKWVACGICRTPAGRHTGQRSGTRSYSCTHCGNVWHESPIGFHAVNSEGEEVVIPAEQLEASSQNGTHA